MWFDICVSNIGAVWAFGFVGFILSFSAVLPRYGWSNFMISPLVCTYAFPLAGAICLDNQDIALVGEFHLFTYSLLIQFCCFNLG